MWYLWVHTVNHQRLQPLLRHILSRHIPIPNREICHHKHSSNSKGQKGGTVGAFSVTNIGIWTWKNSWHKSSLTSRLNPSLFILYDIWCLITQPANKVSQLKCPTVCILYVCLSDYAIHCVNRTIVAPFLYIWPVQITHFTLLAVIALFNWPAHIIQSSSGGFPSNQIECLTLHHQLTKTVINCSLQIQLTNMLASIVPCLRLGA